MPPAVKQEPRLGQLEGPGWPEGLRILVVDDDKDAAESLGMLLELQGNRVGIAFDGPGALQAARDLDPEVILVDLCLPGFDGFEVARRVRSGGEAGGAMLIALTGWSGAESRSRSAEAGFDHHLVKPLDFDVLAHLLRVARRRKELGAGE